MDLSQFLATIRARWATIVALALLGVVVAAAYSAYATPTYTATSKVVVSTPAASNANDLQQGGVFAQQVALTYAEVATTSYVLESVAKTVGGVDPDDLSKAVTATVPANTSVIDITVSASTGPKAAAIANGVASQLAARVPSITPSGKADRSAVSVRTIQTASAPKSPSAPIWPLNIALGLLVGLAIGLGAVLLRNSADTRVRTAEDARQSVDRPVLGAIAFDPAFRQRPLVVAADDRSARAEGFRTLRTNLQFLLLGDRSHAVVVTSSTAAEGKSSSIANLAIAMRDAGKRVVVVDADLRNPRLGVYYGIDGSVGLSDVLIDRVSLSTALQTWRDGLAVLPAGALPPNPSELLQSEAMTDLLERLREDFDVVLLDTPPTLPFTDAAALTRLTDGAVLIVAAGRTGRQTARRSADTIAQAGGKVLGVVLTMTKQNKSEASVFGRYDARRRAEQRRAGRASGAVRSKPDGALGRG